MKFTYVLIILSMLSCKGADRSDSSDYNIKLNTKQSDTTKHLTLYEFLDAIKTRDAPKHLNFLSAVEKFPIDWIKASDIDTLISLVESKEKCRCILNAWSSYIPIDEKADLGGYAILFLNSFRNNKSVEFGLWACPETDKGDVAELLNWKKSLNK